MPADTSVPAAPAQPDRALDFLHRLTSSRAPDVGAVTNLRTLETFLSGLKQEAGKLSAFQDAVREGHAESLKFVAENVNPNRLSGMAWHALGALTGSGPAALKQNCVYCAKAVDQNLEALSSGAPTGFWVASETSAGHLPPLEKSSRRVGQDDSIERLITDAIPPGRRGIISVPQRHEDANHAMNVIHRVDGALHVIDGQNGKLYDLSSQVDHQTFQAKFGHRSATSVARFFETGPAPTPPAISDDWQQV
jgi:hypothetical protein